ncbi:MAG: polyprenyl synthetase family protein [Chloroflexi bacterium]|nr:polyprenyl synthetase family protein [Chloroflexota bacterium]MCL5075628.1 polyprenyl synthetase family protein [Chloroflexota bacterium]
MLSLQGILAKYESELNREIAACIPSPGEAGQLYSMLHYHLGWVDKDFRPRQTEGGKRIRPLLCLLSCEASGGDYHQVLPAAVALELVHNFSLIHDDIQDASHERRHQPTVWSIWGVPHGITAGDTMYTLAFLAMRRLLLRGVEPTLVLEATQDLAQACLQLCEGQYLDISFEEMMNISSESYISMAAKKTAALLGCAAKLGALIGSKQEPLAELYRLFGTKIGIAFQIRDDLLGIWGDEKVTGKPKGDDILHKKKTIPLVYALEKSTEEQRHQLFEIYQKDTLGGDDVTKVIALLERLGAHRHAEEEANAWYQAALVELNRAAPQGWAADQLKQLAAFLVSRTY